VDLHDFINDVPVLINGALEIAFLTMDGDHHLVEAPYVMPRGAFRFRRRA
jgi:hypothetical protein